MHYQIPLSVCRWQPCSVTDAQCCVFAGRRPVSAERPGSNSRLNAARSLMDVTAHCMHHGLNTALPLLRTPSHPHIYGYVLQHLITVISSLWRDFYQSSSVIPQWGTLKGWEGGAMRHVRNMPCVTQRVESQNNWCPLILWVIPTDVDFICLTQKQVRSGLMSNRGGAIRRETPGTSVLPKNPFLTLCKVKLLKSNVSCCASVTGMCCYTHICSDV